MFGGPGGALAPLHVDDDRHGHWLTAVLPAFPYPVAFRVARAVDGRLVCTGMVFGGNPNPDAEPAEVTATHLRQVSPSSLLAAVGRGDRYLSRLAELPGWAAPVTEALGPLGRPRRIRKRALRAGMSGPKTRDLEDLAAEYRAALADPATARKPVAAVAARLNISRHTAQRWRAKAVAAGLLPPQIGERGKR